MTAKQTASITLFMLSTWPFVRGWYEVVILCRMWYFFNVVAILLPTNCGPLSVIMSLGRPYRTNIWNRKLITESSVALGSASASTHLVTYSVATRIMFYVLMMGWSDQQNWVPNTQMVRLLTMGLKEFHWTIQGVLLFGNCHRLEQIS